METKIIVSIVLVMLAGGLFVGCIGTPSPVTKAIDLELEEVVEEEVRDVVDWEWECYYNAGRQIPNDQTVMEFLMADWTEENEYKINYFDCSQMSTYMEWALENSGVDTVFWIGDTTEDGELDHMWLGINLDGDEIYYSYETTGCYWHQENEMWEIKYEFQDIYEVWDWCDGDFDYFYNEFGWWI